MCALFLCAFICNVMIKLKDRQRRPLQNVHFTIITNYKVPASESRLSLPYRVSERSERIVECAAALSAAVGAAFGGPFFLVTAPHSLTIKADLMWNYRADEGVRPYNTAMIRERFCRGRRPRRPETGFKQAEGAHCAPLHFSHLSVFGRIISALTNCSATINYALRIIKRQRAKAEYTKRTELGSLEPNRDCGQADVSLSACQQVPA